MKDVSPEVSDGLPSRGDTSGAGQRAIIAGELRIALQAE